MRHLHLLGVSAIAILGLSACQGKSAETDAPASKNIAVVKTSAADVPRTATKNAYFGDLHVHTKNSFDASIVGTRTNADDAYRFAQGATIDNGAGKKIKLSGPPLDFYGVTDHGEYMGVIMSMQTRGSELSKTPTAKAIFGLTGGSRADRMNAFMEIGTSVVLGEPKEDIYDRDFIDSAWAENVAAAEKHNQPGKFTTFAAYEFTTMRVIGDVADQLGATNLHRNVVFRDAAPKRLFSTLDSPNPENLWEWMNGLRADGMDVMSIPHNSNASNGGMFALVTDGGDPLTKEYAINRLKNEPLVEMTQVKGTSETHPTLSPNDEWADHELYEVLVGFHAPADKVTGSFVRQSLARGMNLEAELGANPYAFGFIGSTDAHVSSSSLSEEDFFGKFSTDLDLESRGSIPPKKAKNWDGVDSDDPAFIIASAQYGASGLAGVWAEANTRDDIYNSMEARETFATSGPRLKVRFFAGDYTDDDLNAGDMVTRAYAKGSPMGSEIGNDVSPHFIAWAIQDPQGVPLDRLQIVKTWYDGGEKEQVYDVACSDGSAPDATTHRCADNGSSVDITTCATSAGQGKSELKSRWQDPNFKAGQAAAYYVRVLENPKCRWSTWDAIRNGTPPNPRMHASLQDRAWSSPIWVK